MSTLNVRLTSQGQPIPYGPAVPGIHVSFGTGDYDAAAFRHYCDLAGAVSIENMPDGPFRVHLRAKGYRDTYRDVVLPKDAAGQIEYEMMTTGEVVPGALLSRLVRIDGHRMVNERGEKVYGRGASMFLLFKKYLDGYDITPQLAQLQGLGYNLIRVMGMFESLGGFNPKAYGDRYYTAIRPFCALCEDYGLYVLWTCCAATGAWMTENEAIDHIKRTVTELKDIANALASPVNEQGQHNNSVNLTRVKNEVDWGWLLHDMGSYGMDTPCSPPFGTHAVLHVNRRYSNSVRDCCPLDNPNYVNDHLQVGIDEPDRYGDEGNGSVEQAADAAGTAYAALFFVYHSMAGERGDMFTGNTLDCATGAVNAMKGH